MQYKLLLLLLLSSCSSDKILVKRNKLKPICIKVDFEKGIYDNKELEKQMHLKNKELSKSLSSGCYEKSN